jgi:hypothetical protein
MKENMKEILGNLNTINLIIILYIIIGIDTVNTTIQIIFLGGKEGNILINWLPPFFMIISMLIIMLLIGLLLLLIPKFLKKYPEKSWIYNLALIYVSIMRILAILSWIKI